MCEVCGRIYGHHPSCPSAPDPESYGKCKMCKEDICEGDDMVEIEGKKYHYDCLSVCDVLEMFDIPIKVAGDD